MKVVSNFEDAQAALAQFMPEPSGLSSVYNLERMQQLVSFIGNPQNRLRIIHVAGTSGKTSTSYYIANLLRAAGQKVGLTISPHLSEINERVQVNMEPLPEMEFCKGLNEFLPLVEASNVPVTWFETMIAFAYWYWAKIGVDYAVVEVGLGGTLDATNVIDNVQKICVITDIGYDHTQVLGNTLAEIAENKAGIIHADQDVFMYEQSQEVMKVAKRRVKQQSAQLHIVPIAAHPEAVALPEYQQRNWQLARSVFNFVCERDHMPRLSSQQMSHTTEIIIPGRMEQFGIKNKTVILDGAHNPQKIRALRETLTSRYDQPITGVISLASNATDQKIYDCMSELTDFCNRIIITSFQIEQDRRSHSAELEKLFVSCHELGYQPVEIITDQRAAVQAALGDESPVVVITGSLYLLSQVRPYILELCRKAVVTGK